MRHSRGRRIEVDSLAEFDHRLAAGASSLAGWRLSGLDLTQRSAALDRVLVAGALFLGCRFARGVEGRLRDRGAAVFSPLPDVPVDSYRSALYTSVELYGDPAAYADSLDARAYAWSRQDRDDAAALAVALHDHAIDQALDRWREGRRLVGVMGGHSLSRDDPGFLAAARLGRLLAARATVATGGGPGAMEAANLGAHLATAPAEALEAAVAHLARVPEFRPSISAWAQAAFEVRAEHPDGTPSLGVPTWHYGHEPPNAFAGVIAKYFHNATREAVLLEICTAGIVFLPGSAGTVQEIFADACENHYADESSVAPMILVGRDYWRSTMPAWPLLRALGAGRAMSEHLHLVATVEQAAELIAHQVAPPSLPESR